jgi:hypothetical protein
MSLVTFNTVRFYTQDDVYHYTADNRPLQDLASNDTLLQEAIDTVNDSVSNLATVVVSPGDVNVVVVEAPNTLVYYTTAITATRTVTMPNITDSNVCTVRVTRASTSTGSFSISIKQPGGANIKSLSSAGTWADFMYTGSAWIQTAAGSL